MTWITGHHNQDVTYWSVSGNDASGDPLFAAPVVIKARWEDRAVVFTTAKGEEATSMAVLFLGQDLDLGGFVFLGVSAAADPLTVEDSLEVQGVSSVPALRGIVEEKKAFLTARTVR